MLLYLDPITCPVHATFLLEGNPTQFRATLRGQLDLFVWDAI